MEEAGGAAEVLVWCDAESTKGAGEVEGWPLGMEQSACWGPGRKLFGREV